MRFHMGISFSWRTIKKFIIPFILGILAYLGFNGIFDNFNLGIIQVNALENYDTTFTIEYRDIDYIYDYMIDSTHTIRDFIDSINNIDSQYYNVIVGHSFSFNSIGLGTIKGINFYLVPKSYTSLALSIFSLNQQLRFQTSSVSNPKGFEFNINDFSNSNYEENSDYLQLLDCLNNNTNCRNPYSYSGINNQIIFADCTTTITNDSNNTCLSPANNTNINAANTRFIYSSQVPLYYSNSHNTYLTSSSYFFKSIVINGKDLNAGDYFPTYKDYLDSLEPDVPDEPSDDNTEHKALFNKIYWLDDKNTEKGILTSIYEVLFLYCLTMILFRILTFLKNKRW